MNTLKVFLGAAVAFSFLLCSPACSEEEPAASTQTVRAQTLKELHSIHKEERKNLARKQKEERYRVKEEAKNLSGTERAAFLVLEMRRLEDEKTDLLRRQSQERRDFFQAHPELKSKSERAAMKESQRKKAQKAKESQAKP